MCIEEKRERKERERKKKKKKIRIGSINNITNRINVSK